MRPIAPIASGRFKSIVNVDGSFRLVKSRCSIKEELHIRKRRVETHRPQQVTLRREEMRVERLDSTE
jgi:hypothetical protein